MRAVIYARVSSDPRGLGRSVSEQEADCRLLADREGWEVVQVFVDQDRSASRYAKLDRPAYRQLADFVARGECDVLVTWEASRFQRDLEAYVQLRELCRRQRVLWSYSGRTYDLSRTDDRLTTGLDALLAERESDVTRERVLRAVRANAIQGRPHGPILYGYKREYDPSSGALQRQVVYEPEAELIREAARRFLSGETPNAIARDFNRRGIPAARSDSWDLTRIRRIITNPAYIAQRVHQGKVIGPANWPPILDEPTYHQAVAKFADPKRKFSHDSSIRYLLTGIATCGVCGARIKYGHPKGYPTYLCAVKFCVARKLEPVDDLVTKLVLARLSRPDAAQLFVRDDTDSAPLLQEVADKRARLEGFYDAAAKGDITPAALGRIEATLLGEITAVEGRLRRVDVPSVVYDLVKAPEAVWKSLHITQKREVIRVLFDVRILKTRRGTRPVPPESIAVTWRGSGASEPVAQPTAAGPAQAAS